MKAFFKTYKPLFLYMPILYVLGNIHTLLSMGLFFLICIGLLRKNKDHTLIIAFVLVIILGDSRKFDFHFIKDLRIVGILAMMIATFRDLAKGRYRFRPMAFWVILITILASISLLSSPIVPTSIQKMLSYTFLLFVMLHYWNFHIKKDGEGLFRDIIKLVAIIYMIGLFLYFKGSSLVLFNARFRGLFGNPNGLGIHTTHFSMLLFFFFRAYPKSFSKRNMTFLVILVIANVLLCGSRNTLASILLFFMLLYFWGGGPIKKTFFILLIIPLISTVVNLEFIVSIVTRVGLAEELRIESILSGTGRFHAWEYAMDVFQEHKWMGRGFGYDQELFKFGTLPEWLEKTGHQGDSHNSFIAFLLNIGIIGLTALILFIIMMLKKTRYHGAGIAIGLAAGFSAFFEPWLSSSLNAYTTLFFLVILLATHFPSNRLPNK